ncbi:hypothetical protein AB0F88_05020 [Streptosporangium sp. NPDC023963]|uniref:hypothetical protein n=1 Tax=Streptosporangium sp. NPDC023963 TaxID=3155608 RepID=UPI00343BFF08
MNVDRHSDLPTLRQIFLTVLIKDRRRKTTIRLNKILTARHAVAEGGASGPAGAPERDERPGQELFGPRPFHVQGDNDVHLRTEPLYTGQVVVEQLDARHLFRRDGGSEFTSGKNVRSVMRTSDKNLNRAAVTHCQDGTAFSSRNSHRWRR